MLNAILNILRSVELNRQDATSGVDYLSMEGAQVSWLYAQTTETMFRGVSGTEHLVSYVGVGAFGPGMKAGAFVRDRFTGNVVGELPVPTAGWQLPFKTLFSTTRSNTLYVFDAGGFPSIGLYFAPIIHEYTYTYQPLLRRFTATLKSSTTLPQPANAPNPIGFCADPIELSNGDLLFPDQFWGALYLYKPATGICTYALGPQNAGLENAFPELCSGVFGLDADMWFNGSKRAPVHFKFLSPNPDGGFAPGLNYLSQYNGYAYFQSLNAGKIYRMPLAGLRDSREPWERISDVELFWDIPGPTDPTEPTGPRLLAGHTFNQYDPSDRRLFVCDFTRGWIFALDTELGPDQREEIIVQDVNLLDSPVTIAFLPSLPLAGGHTFVVANDQEHLLPGLNGYIPFDPTMPPSPPVFPVPFRLAKVTLAKS